MNIGIRETIQGKKFSPAMLLLCFVLFASVSGCGTASGAAERQSGSPAESAEAEAGPAQAETPAAPEPSAAADAEEDPNYAETRPRVSARDELTAVFPAGEIELDFRKSFLANEAQIFTALYEGLFSYHPFTMEPVAAAASRWETSADKKQWTFTIRRNARYSNGDSVRAGDFRAAWLSLLEAGDAPYSSLFDIIEGAREYRLGVITDPGRVGISAPDDRTLVVRLNSPASFFPSMLCHHSFSPIHPAMLASNDFSGTALVSNGPFYLSELSDKTMVLAKNTDYWDSGMVGLEKITIAFTDDGDEAAALWNTGAAHWLAGNVNTEALTDISGVVWHAMFATHYYFIRSQAPWDDYRLRRALSLVLPWNEIRQGYFLPATTLISPMPGYPEIEPESGDVDEALALLADAGYPRGVGLPELVIRITPSPDADATARLMATAWFEKLGVPAKIDVVPFRQYSQSLKADDYQVGYSTWIGDFADPYTFLQMWRRDSNLNDALYSDDRYEALIEKSMTEEGEQRLKTLAEAETLLLSQGSVLPIYHTPAFNIVDTDEIDGWFPNMLDIHPFKYLAFKSFRPLPGVAQAALPVVY